MKVGVDLKIRVGGRGSIHFIKRDEEIPFCPMEMGERDLITLCGIQFFKEKAEWDKNGFFLWLTSKKKYSPDLPYGIKNISEKLRKAGYKFSWAEPLKGFSKDTTEGMIDTLEALSEPPNKVRWEEVLSPLAKIFNDQCLKDIGIGVIKKNKQEKE